MFLRDSKFDSNDYNIESDNCFYYKILAAYETSENKVGEYKK